MKIKALPPIQPIQMQPVTRAAGARVQALRAANAAPRAAGEVLQLTLRHLGRAFDANA